MAWSTTTIATAHGPERGVAPVLVAASRATDIPAFYAPWFVNRLRAGHVLWRNPFNGHGQYVSLTRMRCVVFWSKNPAPLLPFLPELDARGLAYYLHYTLNDYEAEGFEPGLPPLARRVETFCRWADALGPERVVWRFDPLLLAGPLAAPGGEGCARLLGKVEGLARQLAGYTRKLVFSFADIAPYRKVWTSLRRAGLPWRDCTRQEMQTLALGIAQICTAYGLTPATCGETADLRAWGVAHNRCIDPELVLRLTQSPGRAAPAGPGRAASASARRAAAPLAPRSRPAPGLRLRALQGHRPVQYLPPRLRLLLRQHLARRRTARTRGPRPAGGGHCALKGPRPPGGLASAFSIP